MEYGPAKGSSPLWLGRCWMHVEEEGRAEAESLAESIWSFWATGNGERP